MRIVAALVAVVLLTVGFAARSGRVALGCMVAGSLIAGWLLADLLGLSGSLR